MDRSTDLTRSNAFLESSRRELFDALEKLDLVEIEQFAQYEGLCPQCHSPYYGILDESKLTLPIGGVHAFFSRRPTAGSHQLSSGLAIDYGYTSYEVRQNVCRSGLFTRQQLSSVLRLNQHHLEVAERSFCDIRPKRCECDFGESYTEDELLALALMEDPLMELPVDHDFSHGKPVRTGFRKRSESARERRRHKAKKSWLLPVKRVTIPVVHPLARGTNFGVINEAPIQLEFKFLPPGSRQLRSSKPNWSGKRPRNKAAKPVIEPRKGQSKYFYFKRKNGFAVLSSHHPLQDDKFHLRWKHV